MYSSQRPKEANPAAYLNLKAKGTRTNRGRGVAAMQKKDEQTVLSGAGVGWMSLWAPPGKVINIGTDIF